MKKIDSNKINLQGNELKYIKEAINSNRISGDGEFTKKCNQFIENSLQVKKSMLTTSCTHALEMSALLLDIKPGDEVILSPFTFVSTANAFMLRGAIPVFADIRSDTLNIDEKKIEPLITNKTKAIIVVHYAGVACEMDKITNLAKKYDIDIIEDNAHGIFGKYQNNYLGSFGTFGTLSFHETKNFSCGEGGALIINNPKYIERAEILREKGTNRSKFLRGEIDKYSWVDIGSSYLPSEILAAYLYSQFEQKEKIQSKRKKIWNYYNKNLKDWADINFLQLPSIPKHCEQNHHIFYIIMPSNNSRDKLMYYLREKGIAATFHFLPLNKSKMGRQLSKNKYSCPVAVDLSLRLLRLPIHNNLKTELIDLNHFFDFKF